MSGPIVHTEAMKQAAKLIEKKCGFKPIVACVKNSKGGKHAKERR